MDIVTTSNIILIITNTMVAVGTLVLAFYARKNIAFSNEQLRFLDKQTKIFISHQEPYLFVKEKKFKGNKIELSLSNHSEGIAHDIAINTILVLGETKLTKESERLLRETPRENRDKLNLQGNFNIQLDKALILENTRSTFQEEFETSTRSTIVYPSPAVSFIFNSENGQPVLKSGAKDKLFDEFEPFFYFTSNENENEFKPGSIGRVFHFDELRDFLIKNDVKYIGIMFELVCRDKIGKVHSFQDIGSCVVDLETDKTLEEAIKKGRTMPRALGRMELQKEAGWQPYYLYKSLEYGKN